MEILTKRAIEYVKQGDASVKRNQHMNEIKSDESIEQHHIEAVVVDFINYVGMESGIDYALYTSDIKAGRSAI